MSKKAFQAMLEDKGIELWWVHEIYSEHSFRPPSAWVGVSDVYCNRTRRAVAVPRKRQDSVLWALVLHEVAHLEWWCWRNLSPSKQSEPVICELALEIAKTYGFGLDTLKYLESELNEALYVDQEKFQ